MEMGKGKKKNEAYLSFNKYRNLIKLLNLWFLMEHLH